MKHIPVSVAVWRKLRKIRDQNGFKHYSRTLEWLIEQQSIPDKNTAITVSPEMVERLNELKQKNELDSIDSTIREMIHQLEEYQDLFQNDGGAEYQ